MTTTDQQLTVEEAREALWKLFEARVPPTVEPDQRRVVREAFNELDAALEQAVREKALRETTGIRAGLLSRALDAEARVWELEAERQNEWAKGAVVGSLIDREKHARLVEAAEAVSETAGKEWQGKDYSLFVARLAALRAALTEVSDG